jgi:hypothetical protein
MSSVYSRLRLTAAEQFLYVLQCIAFGAGYCAKVPVKKALTELTQVPGPCNADLRSGHGRPLQYDQEYLPAAPHDQSRHLPPGLHGARYGRS